MTEQPSAARLRQRLIERFRPVQVAWSPDGRNVDFAADLDAGLTVGSFGLCAVADDAAAIVVQVRGSHVVEREAAALQVEDDSLSDGTTLVSATIRPVLRSLAGHGVVLGRLDTGFERCDQVAPFGERPVRPATGAETALIVASLAPRPALTIGTLRDAPEVPAQLAARGFGRHTFMCGQSGSGKTYTTGGIFERLIAETTLPLVILDPNSDHIHLGRLRDPDRSDPAAARYLAAADVVVARGRGAADGVLLCADFSDLDIESQARLLRLHPIDDADEYAALLELTRTLGETYSLHDIRRAAAAAGGASDRLAHRIVNLGVADWDVWRRAGEQTLAESGLAEHRCLVFDLGSLTRPDERTAVALAVLGNRWRRRAERQPVLIAVDEAHNVFPSATTDPLLQATSELGVLIAGEGRKFGLHLFVATQRPSKVHPNVVSQCDNLVLMRMNGAGDVADLDAMFSHVPPAMLRSALSFGLGQALVAGPISPVPMVVQVGTRLTPEGGGDVATTWAEPAPTSFP